MHALLEGSVPGLAAVGPWTHLHGHCGKKSGDAAGQRAPRTGRQRSEGIWPRLRCEGRTGGRWASFVEKKM